MVSALVLGAAGAVGRTCWQFLSHINIFDKLFLGDKRVEELRKLVEISRAYNVEVIPVDADDKSSLTRAIEKTDVVLNAVGPFFVYGPKILDAALEVGVDYVDVCDDFDATVKMLERHEEAVARGVKALIGMGSSPGLSNIIVKFAAQRLFEEVESVDIAHVHGGERYEGPAVIMHRAHSMMIDIPVYINGDIVYTSLESDFARQFEQEFDFPNLGKFPVYLYPHPETYTLPKYFRIAKRVTNLGVVLPPQFPALIRALVRIGLFSDEEVEVSGVRLRARDFAVAYVLKKRGELLEKYGPIEPVGSLVIVIEGRHSGRRCKLTFYTTAHGLGMGDATGIPLGLGGIMMVKGMIQSPGVHPPEAVIDPVELFKLAKEFVATKLGKGIPVNVIEECNGVRREYNIETLFSR
ncbi:MAG: saccharopine dehydrogenase NADP-binding domain-containing protein [Thermofilaceae archaeon]|nr:saccharopine dehydrogenase NADP-binding domain-containing protein [Thermofilaceae archaeon]MCX8180477.1 saccharopine dehydrogenase NADP-binding domain-containing protein [Thermofilaceae archaeon]MDW8003326.1 saccharopine dehydrogenase NADP-binding domain-containing protein [Thermofilaceae archaeon]